ncbi:hypothetical protein AZI86_02200 [Bdellovibrio bacteriovorus]|uniref:Uncharacterized protein n=1 Tax=Bdellovibrio bacteriovorus TaxID=959 RepID=A0A150WND9_BDEBC|nr:DUF4105 domain-containing protein [Bdellovibrio bacteriovorus]KYG65908.1 hypothetical protein AZI86_02200 [Bdellovibrio bacteriovorus]
MKFILLLILVMSFQKTWAFMSDEAQIDKVSQSTAWLRLLHYEKTWNGYQSQLDGKGFFFAEGGDTDPKAELQASFKDIIENTKIVGKFKLTPRCAFPERTRFLNETFHLQLKPVACPVFESFMGRFHNPQGLSLVFSSAYPNNPASMFGHTFLKIKSDRDTDLLDNGVNFAAAVADDENPFAFMYFGVTGGYPGQWSVQPYYVKVREYVNFESRELWEYEFNFTPEETRRLLAHLWEIETNTYFDYYFFDENCSYQVLKAIEAIKPDWNLDHHKIYMIPGESIKFALRQEGVLKSVKYRPSLYKKMWQRYSGLTKDEKNIFKSLTGKKISVDQISSRPVLDSAVLYLDYLKSEDKDLFEGQLKDLHQQVLQRRAQLGVATIEEEKRFPELTGTTRPDWGHDSYYWSWGGGHRQYQPSQDETFTRLRLRSSYHDLLNHDLGYSPFSQIEFPSVEFQYNDRNREFHIEEVLGLATTSLTPVNDLRTPISYRMSVGMKTDREYIRCDECSIVSGEAGGGMTFASSQDRAWFYTLILAKIDLADHLMKGYAYSPGLEMGLLFNPVDKYKAQLEVRYFCDVNAFDDCRNSTSYAFRQSFSLGRNQELRNINLWVTPDSRVGNSYWEASLSFIQFFN